ncbi:hypothetical protein M758_3G005000 [Ceratodon purpureus]|nr:hypothetical protein M758_3G005000 [Ceratodon purpureus]
MTKLFPFTIIATRSATTLTSHHITHSRAVWSPPSVTDHQNRIIELSVFSLESRGFHLSPSLPCCSFSHFHRKTEIGITANFEVGQLGHPPIQGFLSGEEVKSLTFKFSSLQLLFLACGAGV